MEEKTDLRIRKNPTRHCVIAFVNYFGEKMI